MQLAEFLLKSGAVKIAIGFMISSQAMAFVNELIASLVTPLVNHLLDKGDKVTNGLKVKAHGIEFDFGRVIVAFVRILVHIVIVFAVVNAIPDTILKL